MRQELILAFVRDCQIFAGRASRLSPRVRLELIVKRFVERIPGDLSPAETLFVGRILEHVAIGLARETHTSFHRTFDLGGERCAFDAVKAAGALLLPLQSKPPGDAFGRFAGEYLQAFRASHRIPAAVRAEELIRQHLGRGLTIAALAHEIGSHPVRLRAEFAQRYGMTIRQYRTRRRLRRAARLLKCSNRSVSEIAERVGFGSRDAFYAAFRRRYRATPGEYRARRQRSERSHPEGTSKRLAQ